jgi:3-polyprenyl-4-hydroxybenzoate decarboxylase
MQIIVGVSGALGIVYAISLNDCAGTERMQDGHNEEHNPAGRLK